MSHDAAARVGDGDGAGFWAAYWALREPRISTLFPAFVAGLLVLATHATAHELQLARDRQAVICVCAQSAA